MSVTLSVSSNLSRLHFVCKMGLIIIVLPYRTSGSDGKESTCNGGDVCSIPGVGRSPGGGPGNPLQYSCLENAMDRGDWQTTVHSISESDMTEVTEHAHK